MLDRRDPSPQVSRTLDRLRQFLTLIGLTALLVGGVGVANAVATFIDKRRKVIATMKSVGATSRMVLGIFLTQIVIVAAIGILIGLALGTIVPIVLNAFYGDMVPIHVEMTVSALSVVSALVYGFAVALLFTLWPLARIERVSANVLFRDEVAHERAIAARLGRRRDAGNRRRARRLCALHVGFKARCPLFLRRPHGRFRAVFRARHGRHLGGAPSATTAHAGAGARCCATSARRTG